jgi:Flp pilus assembly pilin Flp
MVRSILRKWFADEEAATASEYAFMLVLIICAVIASVSTVGNSVANGWSNNASKVSSACNGS